MLFTLTTSHHPATDLGFLLHKHPDKAQSLDIAAGTAHVFYPRADEAECTAALLLDIDPVGLVRGQRGGSGFAIGQYVNDRPYVSSSMMAVAIGRVFRTALNGRCEARPELPAVAMPLRLHLPAVPCQGGPDLVSRLFAPLGWQVDARPIPLDDQLPDWGDSRYVDLSLTGTLRVADALSHLYVLLPVLDNAKHYWVADAEVDKLLRIGEGWLAEHPERELITRRYLVNQRELVNSALARLAEADDSDIDDLDNALQDATVVDDAAPVPLAVQRRTAVLDVLRTSGAHRVIDLGCGDGALLRDLLAAPEFAEILGVDVSARALEVAAKRLRLDRLPEHTVSRITLRQSALTYVDKSLRGYDAAVLMEVIEHIDPPRLAALERTVFGDAKPGTVIVTTPNSEYNVRFPSLPAGQFRHPDHRFEWDRAQFRQWADGVAGRTGYTVRYLPAGAEDPEVGPPTQLAVFSRVGVTA